MATRAEVFDAIHEEREYQINRWGDLDASNSVGDFLLYMQRELKKAEDAYRNPNTVGNDTPAIEGIRKVVTTGVAAMERHGAPRRGAK